MHYFVYTTLNPNLSLEKKLMFGKTIIFHNKKTKKKEVNVKSI